MKITFSFTDKSSRQFTNVEMPYEPYKAADGYYSRFYNKVKKMMEPKSGISQIKGVKKITGGKTDRLIIKT